LNRRLFEDTSPEAEKILVAKLREAGSTKRLAIALSLTTAMRRLSLAGLKRRHPDASERSLLLRMARLTYGKEVANLIPEQEEGRT